MTLYEHQRHTGGKKKFPLLVHKYYSVLPKITISIVIGIEDFGFSIFTENNNK